MRSKKVFLICGVPGSGKSTWVKNQISLYGGKHISRDEIRFNMLAAEDGYFAKEDDVFTEFCHQAQRAIDDDITENIYVDATHLTNKSRLKTLKRLNTSKCEVIIVSFKVSLDECKKRNAKRTGRALVPDTVIERMYNSYFIPYNGNKTLWVVNENGEVAVYP